MGVRFMSSREDMDIYNQMNSYLFIHFSQVVKIQKKKEIQFIAMTEPNFSQEVGKTQKKHTKEAFNHWLS